MCWVFNQSEKRKKAGVSEDWVKKKKEGCMSKHREKKSGKRRRMKKEDWNASFLFRWWLKFIGSPPLTSLYPLHPSLYPSIHPPPHPPFDAEAISQQSQPFLPAKLIWQVCIKAPDQYPLRAVRAKAKKNNAPASPPLPLYQMRKNESWTLFSPLLIRSAVLSPALYQTDTHAQINTHTDTWNHTNEHRRTYTDTRMQLQASLSPGWPPAIDR